MNITKLFISAVAKYPDTVAIIEKNKTITYEQLLNDVIATAAYFESKNIAKGDRVLVFVPMSIDLYRIVLALFYLGATAVFLDEWVSKKRLELCCELAHCKGFIGVFKARLFSYFSKGLRQIEVKLSLTKTLNKPLPLTEVASDNAALITFTTGSTGTPKAALRSHDFLNEQFKALLEEIEPKDSDVDMPILPIVLFVNLGVGCTSVIANFNMAKPNSINPTLLENQLNKHKVNRITASPFVVKRLAEHAIKHNRTFADVEKIFTGGAPVFPEEARIYQMGFPKATSTILYGSTEAEPISSISVQDLINRGNQLNSGLPVGQLFHKAVVRIIRIIDNEIPAGNSDSLRELMLNDGEVGEIIVSGPHILKRYYNNEPALRRNKIIIDKVIWHRTGDSGFMQGKELFLTGPCSQLVHRDHGYISPFLIESKLQVIDGISAGTLINLSDKNILVLEGKTDQDTLDQYINKDLYDKIIMVSKIPRDPRHNSKIDYKKLKQELSKSVK